jgi:hypothetical protein
MVSFKKYPKTTIIISLKIYQIIIYIGIEQSKIKPEELNIINKNYKNYRLNLFTKMGKELTTGQSNKFYIKLALLNW